MTRDELIEALEGSLPADGDNSVPTVLPAEVVAEAARILREAD